MLYNGIIKEVRMTLKTGKNLLASNQRVQGIRKVIPKLSIR